ncbi:hypothetical protein R3P38DRAFT_2806457 [Favolaschia claudopus]|uniref:Uncharacterized protein n=1 Tax=Favolaschia claudopus TaxID=2862362 RepID=A0AAV9ZJQ8_9AGAR
MYPEIQQKWVKNSINLGFLGSSSKLENDADTIKAQDWFTHKKKEGWVIPRIANSLSIASPDNWDIIPGAAGVPNGPQNQGSDVEDSGRKGAGFGGPMNTTNRKNNYCVRYVRNNCWREDFEEAGHTFSILDNIDESRLIDDGGMPKIVAERKPGARRLCGAGAAVSRPAQL